MDTVQASLELDALKEVQAVMGEDFPLLVEAFFKDSAALLSTIHNAIDEDNSESLRRAAHNFKGSASNMSATALAVLCQELEGLAFSGTTVGSRQLMTHIVEEYKQVKTALEDVLNPFDLVPDN